MGAGGSAIFVACAVLLVSAVPASGQVEPVSLLANPDAEAGLGGWHRAGVGLASYAGDGVSRDPAPENLPPGLSEWQLGLWLFAGEGAIWQTVDLSALAGTIDSGSQPLYISGLSAAAAPGGERASGRATA